MSRSQTFSPEREPLREIAKLHLQDDKTCGPLSFLNPTQAHFRPGSVTEVIDGHQQSDTANVEGESVPGNGQASNVEYRWTSRNNRKGRHTLVVNQSEDKAPHFATPPATDTAKEVLKNVRRMFTYFPVWDVSYLVATTFTWGSVIWVINAFFAFLPYTNPESEFPGEILYSGGITAFIGATVFEIGSVLLMLEAVNENRSGCFGWALERLYDDQFDGNNGNDNIVARIVANKDECTHHHRSKGNLVGKSTSRALTEKSLASGKVKESPNGNKAWVWFPSLQELHTHYLHDLGFLACSSQMIGATVFWISGVTALPPIFLALNTTSKLNGAYWIPQVIGGLGFVVSGTLFMVETQQHWWRPAPSVLGWHIGLWNLIGGIGFTLCPIFGLLGTMHWAEYQASCSTFWGSWAFLVGSAIQWYESLNKYPVEVSKGD